MTVVVKVGRWMLLLAVLGFLGSLVVSFQGKVAGITTGLFLQEECASGAMPKDSDAFLRQAERNARIFALSFWTDYGIDARVVSDANGRRLRVAGTYLWPFVREEPLENDRGAHRNDP